MTTAAYMQGMATGAGLIVAIGAQNAFVLSCAIRRNHHLAVAAVCIVCDALLIAAGVTGVGSFIASDPVLRFVAAAGGALFLGWFGWGALRSALRPGSLEAQEAESATLYKVLATTLGVTLLNPHVYLDTVVMLGAISGSYVGEARFAFGYGAASASFMWFILLALAGQMLAPVFRKPAAWRILDGCVCAAVWLVAWSLAAQAWTGWGELPLPQ